MNAVIPGLKLYVSVAFNIIIEMPRTIPGETVNNAPVTHFLSFCGPVTGWVLKSLAGRFGDALHHLIMVQTSCHVPLRAFAVKCMDRNPSAHRHSIGPILERKGPICVQCIDACSALKSNLMYLHLEWTWRNGQAHFYQVWTRGKCPKQLFAVPIPSAGLSAGLLFVQMDLKAIFKPWVHLIVVTVGLYLLLHDVAICSTFYSH